MIENLYRSSFRIWRKLDFSRQIFEKYSNIKYNWNPSSGSRVVPCGQTDGHDEADSRFSQFAERAYKQASAEALSNTSNIQRTIQISTLNSWTDLTFSWRPTLTSVSKEMAREFWQVRTVSARPPASVFRNTIRLEHKGRQHVPQKRNYQSTQVHGAVFSVNGSHNNNYK